MDLIIYNKFIGSDRFVSEYLHEHGVPSVPEPIFQNRRKLLLQNQMH